jgi:hypothetical protein
MQQQPHRRPVLTLYGVEHVDHDLVHDDIPIWVAGHPRGMPAHRTLGLGSPIDPIEGISRDSLGPPRETRTRPRDRDRSLFAGLVPAR